MIAILRKNIKKIGFQIILWLIFFALVLELGLRIGKSSQSSADSIGSVNGLDISKSDFVRKIQQETRFLNQIKDQLGADGEALLKQQGYMQKIEERVINDLVNEKLIDSFIQKLGVKISPDYMERKITDSSFVMDSLSDYIPQEAFMMPGGLNLEIIMHYLQRQGISDEVFDEKIKFGIERYLLNEMLLSGIYIPDQLLKEQYIRFYSKKKFAFITFKLSDYVKRAKDEQSNVSDEELKSFYQKNSQIYVVPEKREGVVYTFSPDSYGLSVNDKDIQEYYIKNKREFLETPESLELKRIVYKSEKEAQEAYNGLKDHPEKFDEKAGKSFNYKHGEKDTRFDVAAYALAKNGDMTGVTRTDEGYEIIKRIGRKESKYKELEKVKESIKAKFIKDRFLRLFNLDAQRVIAQSHEAPDIFDKFISSKKAASKNVSLNKSGDNVARKLFGLQEGMKSYFVDDSKGYIIQLKTIHKSYLPELSTIKTKVLADYYDEKAKALLNKEINQAQAKVLSGQSLESIAKEFKATYDTTSMLDLKSEEANKILESKKLPSGKLNALSKVKSILKEVGANSGHIIQLIEVSPIGEKEFDAKKLELTRSLYQSELGLLAAEFMAYLKNSSKITIKQDVIKKTQR